MYRRLPFICLFLVATHAFQHLPFSERKRLARDRIFRMKVVVCTQANAVVPRVVLDLISQELYDAGDDGSIGQTLHHVQRDCKRMARRAVTSVLMHESARILHDAIPYHPPHM